MLIILDGWGINQNPEISAIQAANTPTFDRIVQQYPNNVLVTHGLQVGLPEGQMGNSEVGHLNIGAGRIVYQELTRIDLAVENGTLARNENLLKLIETQERISKPVHLMGLLSDGGVHSHINHLLALCTILSAWPTVDIYIHAFTDGRDCDPHSGLIFLEKLKVHISNFPNIHLASICGRYYAMDRDRRWERTAMAYEALVNRKALLTDDFHTTIQKQYEEGVTDEFIKPLFSSILNTRKTGSLKEGDAVLFFNFRTDRPRQLVEVLTQKSIPEYGMYPLKLSMVTMTPYDAGFRNVSVIFETEKLRNTLGEVLEENGKTQLRAAETEKYPHVTYFLSGGREAAFENEYRILVPSPKVATYDLQPEMSAHILTEKVADFLISDLPDFVCINFANTDMVGHTGIFSAAIKAAETVDNCLDKLLKTAQSLNYAVLVIADHGNADYMVNPDGSPNTAHSMNPVPVILIHPESNKYTIAGGKLADIAPTLLHLMSIEKPEVMHGVSLLTLKNQK